MSRRGAFAAAVVCLLVVAAAPAGGASVGFGAASVAPTDVSTGATTTLSLSVNATSVNTTDGTTGANVTVSVPSALDLSGASVDAEDATPNATGVTASVDGAANAVVVSWDDDGGVDAETVTVTATVAGVAVDRTRTYDLTAAVDADGDGVADATGTVGTVTASATGSDRSVAGSNPTLYLGESDVDVTRLPGAAAAGESQRFYGVGGEAEGTVAFADDAAAVDPTVDESFTTGVYSLDSGSGAGDLTVSRPHVTDVRISPGTSTGGVDVAGSSVPASVGTLTVQPRFDFAPADDARVVVTNPDGLNVTGELTADATVSASDGTVTLDTTDLDVGTYTVRVEGATDLDDVNATTTVRIRSAARTVSVSRTRVVRGERTVATVSGEPGAVRRVRVAGDALRDGESVTVPTAKAVFGAADGLVLVGADGDRGVLYAVVALDDDGFAKVEIETDRLRTGTHDVSVAPNGTADAEASVPFTVRDRTVTASPSQSSAPVGETVTVSGTAPGADRVKLYANVGGEYAPLVADSETGDLAETDVASDGSWEVDLDTRAVVSVPEQYRLAAVADPGDAYAGSSDRIAESTLRGFDAAATTTLRTTDPAPSATASRSRISTAATDEVRVTGRAPGPTETVRAYVVSPRGAVDARDVDVPEENDFEFEYADFADPGTYHVLVVTAGRDGAFGFADGRDAAAIDGKLTGSETAAQAVARVRDAYGGAGVDDRVLELNVTATDPRVDIDAVSHRDGELVVTGTTNRENGTVVALDLQDGAETVSVADAEVNGSGRWRTAVDVAGVADGEYRLRVETPEAFDARTVTVGAATPTGTPASSVTLDLGGGAAGTATESATPTPAPTARADETRTPTATTADDAATGAETPGTERTGRAETAGAGDGFEFRGAFAALASALAALFVRRRR